MRCVCYTITIKDEGSHEDVAFPFAIVFIAIVVSLYGVIYAIDHVLPTPLEISDEAKHPDSFIAERARDYLKPLVDIGPKVAGHPNNEVDAVNYLMRVIEDIIGNAHSSQKITLALQEQTGSFFLDYKPHGSINVYANIQNIIVKVQSKTESSKDVLVNSHFDTVPSSPGGSDDGLMVAVSLEVLRKLSQATERPTNHIVFLFNGAEEAGLIASHAFLAHEWAKDVGVLINLEAAGAGGKEILFQTAPEEPWLLKYYNVPHPHGTVAGEELLQSKIIRFDTDFQIFRDHGGLIGYNFAFTRDGYSYHTKYDGFDNIEFGRFQHTGDNILRLVRNLAEAPEVAHPKTDGEKTVFYDIFGLFFIQYSETTAIAINSVVIVISILLFVWGCYGINPRTGERFLFISEPGVTLTGRITITIIYVLNVLLMLIGSWPMSIAVPALLSTILDACNRTMTWYSVPALIFGLYVAPICAALLTTNFFLQSRIRGIGLTASCKALIQVHSVRTVWTILLLVGTILGIRMVYIIMIGVLFNVVAMIIVHVLEIFKPKLTSKIWPFIYMISTVIPTMITYHYGHELIALFIPIMGRYGSDADPDLQISVVVFIFTVMIASYYVPLFIYVKKPCYVIMILLAVFVAAIIVAFTPIGFPYTFNESHPRLQRYSIYHTMRTIRNDQNVILKDDAGFYFTRADRNTPHTIEGIVTSLEKATSIEKDCNLTLACGLPITNPRSIDNMKSSIWIPAKQPPFGDKIKYDWSSRSVSSSAREFTFSVEGSSKIDLYLSIRKGYTLLDLDLVEELPETTLTWNDQPTYYISFQYGKSSAPLTFTFTVQTSSGWSTPVADVAITTKYVDGSKEKTKEYKDFLGEFPEWTTFMVTGLAQYENVVLT